MGFKSGELEGQSHVFIPSCARIGIHTFYVLAHFLPHQMHSLWSTMLVYTVQLPHHTCLCWPKIIDCPIHVIYAKCSLITRSFVMRVLRPSIFLVIGNHSLLSSKLGYMRNRQLCVYLQFENIQRWIQVILQLQDSQFAGFEHLKRFGPLIYNCCNSSSFWHRSPWKSIVPIPLMSERMVFLQLLRHYTLNEERHLYAFLSLELVNQWEVHQSFKSFKNS